MSYSLNLCLLVVATFLAAAGHMFFKKVALLNIKYSQKIQHPYFIIGTLLFIFCPILSSIAARVIDFSIIYAMSSLTIVFVFLLSLKFLNETLDPQKTVGCIVIMIGLLVMVLGV